MDRRHFATRLSIFAAAFVPAAVRGQKPTMTIPGNKQVIGEGQNKDQPGIYGVNLHGGDGVDGQSDSGNGMHGSANKLFNGSEPWDYLMFTRLSSELSIILFLIVFTAGTVSAQRVDYEKREIQASPQVKQKLADFRSRIQVKKLRYKVAYTEVFEAPIASLTGLIVPKNLNTLAIKQNAFARQRLKADDAAKAAYEKRIGKSVIEFQLQATPQSTFFDWRQQGIVTDVKNQNPCGSCWDFGALAAYDSSYQRRNGVKLSLSEQEILDCSKAGTCKGGWHTTVFDYLIGNEGQPMRPTRLIRPRQTQRAA
jgi:Papain family cysteine protease